MAKRYIKLYEQITGWEWFQHPPTLSLFIYLLCKANYCDRDFHGRMVHRGQLVTSLPKLATGTGLSIQQTRTALSHLISTGEVTDESSSQNRIITIVRYDEYQTSTDESTGNQQTINRRSNRQSTDDLTPSIEYIEYKEMNKKDKKDNNKPLKRFVPPTVEEVEQYCWERKNHVSASRFVDYYESVGWMVGSGGGKGKPMKDWKAAVRRWERDERTEKDYQNDMRGLPT